VNHEDKGGEPPCFAHLSDDEDGESAATQDSGPFGVDLGGTTAGPDGAIWSLPHGGDLDANLVRLGSGKSIGKHLNQEVDVLIFVQSGSGEITVDEAIRGVDAGHLVLIPKGTHRSITGGETGITYLSVHRRNDSLGIKPRPARLDEPGRDA